MCRGSGFCDDGQKSWRVREGDASMDPLSEARGRSDAFDAFVGAVELRRRVTRGAIAAASLACLLTLTLCSSVPPRPATRPPSAERSTGQEPTRSEVEAARFAKSPVAARLLAPRILETVDPSGPHLDDHLHGCIVVLGRAGVSASAARPWMRAALAFGAPAVRDTAAKVWRKLDPDWEKDPVMAPLVRAAAHPGE